MLRLRPTTNFFNVEIYESRHYIFNRLYKRKQKLSTNSFDFQDLWIKTEVLNFTLEKFQIWS